MGAHGEGDGDVVREACAGARCGGDGGKGGRRLAGVFALIGDLALFATGALVDMPYFGRAGVVSSLVSIATALYGMLEEEAIDAAGRVGGKGVGPYVTFDVV